MVTKQQMEAKLFPEIIGYALDILPRLGLKDLDVNGPIISLLMAEYGGVNIRTTVQLLEDAGAFGNPMAENILKRYPQLRNGTAPAQPSVVVAPQVVPVVAPVAQVPPAFVALAANTVVQTVTPPVAPPPAAAGVPDVANTVANLKFQVFRDTNGVLRTADGQYVCALCIKTGVTEPFIGKTLKNVGPHTKHHPDKDKSSVDAIQFPFYTEATTQPVEPPAATLQSAPVAVQAVTVAPAVEPQAEVQFANTQHSTVPEQSSHIEQPIDPTSPGFGSNFEVLARIEKLETTIAQLTLVLLTLPPENLKALYDHYGTPHLEKLGQILGRK